MTNLEILEAAYKRAHGDEPPPSGPVSPWMTRPQLISMALLLVLVVIVGVFASVFARNTGIKVTAEVVLCGGPPGPCRVGTFSSCPPCLTTSSVTITNASGLASIERVRLIRGRATTHLKPGPYVFMLIATGSHHRRSVLATRHVRVGVRGSPTVRFVMQIR